jgi:hypothetical protein
MYLTFSRKLIREIEEGTWEREDMGREMWNGNGEGTWGRKMEGMVMEEGEEDGGNGNGRGYRDRWQLGQGQENKERDAGEGRLQRRVGGRRGERQESGDEEGKICGGWGKCK